LSDERPFWLRALEPLRSEAAMFRVLMWTVAIAIVLVVAVTIARAIF
jgi:hypothetical protein